MQKVKFHIVVHTPELIEFFENTKKYERLQDYVYVLVGEHQEDHTSPQIIQCNKLPDNIEHRKNLLAYTGWYAIAINFKPETEYTCFLEYDTDLTENFNLKKLEEELDNNDAEMCGFFSLDTQTAFLNNDIFSNRLIDFLKEAGIREVEPNNHKWIVSNNVIFKRATLQKFFADGRTKRFLEFLEDDKMAGHFLERYTTAYCFLNKIKFFIEQEGMFVHRALDSHNTQNRKYGKEGYEQFKITNKIPN